MSDIDVENLISSVMSNESLMKKISDIVDSSKGSSSEDALPSVINAIKEGIGEQNDEKPKQESEHTDQNGIFGGNNALLDRLCANSKKNIGLLCALKPFLSDSKSEMIDSIIKFERLAEILRLAK